MAPLFIPCTSSSLRATFHTSCFSQKLSKSNPVYKHKGIIWMNGYRRKVVVWQEGSQPCSFNSSRCDRLLYNTILPHWLRQFWQRENGNGLKKDRQAGGIKPLINVVRSQTLCFLMNFVSVSLNHFISCPSCGRNDPCCLFLFFKFTIDFEKKRLQQNKGQPSSIWCPLDMLDYISHHPQTGWALGSKAHQLWNSCFWTSSFSFLLYPVFRSLCILAKRGGNVGVLRE